MMHRHRSLSVASSTGSNHGTVSSTSSFSPERDESNTNSQLPRIRTTARNYNRWAPREPTDVIINTSAIGRAFPGFSQGDSSDDSMSLEAQRAPKRHHQHLSPARVAQSQYSDNIDSSNIVTLDNVKILSTPKKSPAIMPRRDTGSHKENIPPHSDQQPSKQPAPYVSRASRTTSGERRAFADLRAKVTDDTDGSIQTFDERPAVVTFQPKSTRFATTTTTTTTRKTSNLNAAHLGTPRHNTSNANAPPSHNANVSTKRHEVEDDLAERLRAVSGTPSKSQIKSHTNYTMTSNTINPTQQSFLLPTMPETSEVIPASFNKGTGVPLPREEQDIYSNIDSLKIQVADLESQLAQALSRSQQLEEEAREFKRLSLVRNNQFKLQMEKDQAVAQLAKSLKENSQWESENAQLLEENTELNRHIRHLTKSLSKSDDLEKENTKLHQRLIHLAKTHKLSEQLQRYNAELKVQIAESDVEIAGLRKELDQRQIFEEDPTDRQNEQNQQYIVTLEAKLDRREKLITKMQLMIAAQSSKQDERHRTRASRQVKSQSLEQHERSGSRATRQERTSSCKQDDRSGPQVTHHQRSQSLKQAERSETQTVHKERTQTFTLDGQFETQPTHNEKSQTFTLDERTGFTQNDISQALTQTGRMDKSLDSSFASILGHGVLKELKSTRRNHIDNDDMTSRFIIPDISINEDKTVDAHPILSTDARRVLDSLCKHDCANCTVCTRVASFDSKKDGEQYHKSTIHIPKPVPVSKRMPTSTPYEDAPTIRPSMDPDLALAKVIKGLEDEITHLKLEHTRIATAYAKHDASLGMRQRKTLKKRMDELLTEIEAKSDHIYHLYDVVEGQDEDAS